MAEENIDQSQKNKPAALTAPPVGTRLPDDPGKPKRRRRRGRRGRGRRTQLPDSVVAGQQQSQQLARQQQQARLGSLDQELKPDVAAVTHGSQTNKTQSLDNNDKHQSADQKTSSSANTSPSDQAQEESLSSTLPALRVNGKPYRPAEKRGDRSAAKVDKNATFQKKLVVKKDPDIPNKLADVGKKVHIAFAGKKPDAPAETIAAETIYQTSAPNEKRHGRNNRTGKNNQQIRSQSAVIGETSSRSKAEAPILDTGLAQASQERSLASESSRHNQQRRDKESEQKEAEATAHRFTPHLSSGLKGSTPTFSLQDIQRARRRRRIWGSLLLLILLAAAYFLWAGIQQARQSVGEMIGETNKRELEQLVPTSEVPQPHTKATLSGKVVTGGLHFPSVTVDRIAIYIRYGEENSFRDTGIRLMRGEEKWSFSQADSGESYEIQAVLIDNGRQIAYSDVVTATAPAAEIVLTFPAGSGEVPTENIRDNLADQAPAEPVLQLSESPTISGVVRLEGDFPAGAQVVIWLGEDHGGQVRQDAYTFGISSSETAYTISELKADVNYVMDAVLQSADGQILGLAGQSLLARSPATDANFVIKLN
ncbi:hypothetical protein IJJ08_02305 [bacterium]|nr:hypothetical protein [bacterium]